MLNHENNPRPSGLKCTLITLTILIAGLAFMAFHASLPTFVSGLNSGLRTLPYMPQWDDAEYSLMAHGQYGQVCSPFIKRMLYPWLVHVVSTSSGISVPAACLTLNLIAWATLAWCITAFLDRYVGKPWVAAVVLLTPVPLESLLRAYMPDLFHAAMLSVFFYLLMRGRQRWALVMMLVAFLTRESTALLCVCTAIVAWRRALRPLFWGSLMVLGAGVVAGSRFAHLGLPNVHHLPDFLYLMIKVPYNFILNFFGWTFGSNTDPTTNPWVVWNLPPSLRIGAVKWIEFSIEPVQPLELVVRLATVFAFVPLLVSRWRKWLGPTAALPEAVELAFFYGFTSLVLGPSLGCWVGRLIEYGWPLIWIAFPFMVAKAGIKIARGEAVFLIILYQLIAWYPVLVGFWDVSGAWVWLLLIPVLYVFVWRSVIRIEATNRSLRFSSPTVS